MQKTMISFIMTVYHCTVGVNKDFAKKRVYFNSYVFIHKTINGAYPIWLFGNSATSDMGKTVSQTNSMLIMIRSMPIKSFRGIDFEFSTFNITPNSNDFATRPLSLSEESGLALDRGAGPVARYFNKFDCNSLGCDKC
jgi:hypothetical protein